MDWGWEPPHMFARVEDPFVVQAARPRFRRRMVSNNEWGRAPPFFPDRGEFLEVDDGHDMRRARSQNGRLYAPHPSALPVVINNNIRQEELLQMRGRPVSMHEPEMDHDREHAQHPHRPHSRDPSPRHMWHHEQENDQMKKELEAFKKEKERKEQEQRIKDQLILQRAREEQKAREEADMKKKIQEEAIKEWKNKELVRIAEEDKKKREEAEKKKKLEEEAIKRWQREQKDKADKEKQEKEEKEKEYKERLKRDLGLSDTQVAKVISKENSAALDLKRTTYMKIARRHISIETLRVFNLPYKLDDHDPEGYVLVKRWVPEYEQDRLWEHTRRIREERESHRRKLLLEEAQVEFIRKKKVVRSKSPRLLDLFAPRR